MLTNTNIMYFWMPLVFAYAHEIALITFTFS